MTKDPNAHQGRGEQPPVDGAWIVLATVYALALWCFIAVVAAGASGLIAWLRS